MTGWSFTHEYITYHLRSPPPVQNTAERSQKRGRPFLRHFSLCSWRQQWDIWIWWKSPKCIKYLCRLNKRRSWSPFRSSLDFHFEWPLSLSAYQRIKGQTNLRASMPALVWEYLRKFIFLFFRWGEELKARHQRLDSLTSEDSQSYICDLLIAGCRQVIYWSRVRDAFVVSTENI